MAKAAKKMPDVPTVVYTMIIGRKNYITKTRLYHVPPKIVADWTPDRTNAKVYSSLKAAREAIGKIYSAYDREYFTEPAKQ